MYFQSRSYINFETWWDQRQVPNYLFHLYYPYSGNCSWHRELILPSSLYLPLFGSFWVFFSGNHINPQPGTPFPPARGRWGKVWGGNSQCQEEQVVTLLPKKDWLKLFQFRVNLPKIIPFEIIYSSFKFQTPHVRAVITVVGVLQEAENASSWEKWQFFEK